MGKYITLPNVMALDYILKPDEHIICKNASIVIDANGEFSCWFNNDGYITVYTKDEGEND